MKLTILEDQTLQFEEVFNGVQFKTEDGEIFHICMRDTGFEFYYMSKLYEAKEGKINLLKDMGE